MRKSYWTWGLATAAVVLISAYSLMNYLNRHGGPMVVAPPIQQGPVRGDSMGTGVIVGANPLLTADKAAVSRWFPGYCFAELYVRKPSYEGRLIPHCVGQVIQNVKAETGVTLIEADVRSAEVIAHFKSVYGPNAPWRK